MKFLSNLKSAKKGETALVRIDLNIETEDIGASLRVERSLQTIRYLRDRGYRVVLLSHRGRPAYRTGRLKEKDKKLTLKPFTVVLSKKLGQQVSFHNSIEICSDAICLLENLRFFPGENANDVAFAKKLAALGDIYVQDAFAFSHRKTASMYAITKFLPSYAGISLIEELNHLSNARRTIKKPFTLIVGGAKVSDKMPLIGSLGKKADHILIGGGVANTFFYEHGIVVGDSLREEFVKLRMPSNLVTPIDVIIKNKKILDIGPRTADLYADIIRKSAYVVWGGPLGDTDRKEFWNGSKKVFDALCTSRAQTVIGGGETTSFVRKQNKKIPKHVFLSTGGGAMLEYLAGKKLPGIEALK